MSARAKKAPKKSISKKHQASHTKDASFLGQMMWSLVGVSVLAGVLYGLYEFNVLPASLSSTFSYEQDAPIVVPPLPPKFPPLNKILYDNLLNKLAHYVPQPIVVPTATSETSDVTTVTVPEKPPLWPVQTDYPNDGALLPFNRIIAYYGNFYSNKMGILGEYPDDELIEHLQRVVDEWNAADPDIPAMPAIDYIAITAQGSAGADGMYRLRMPDDQIDHALALARKMNGILFLDIQIGLSTLQEELPELEKYLKMDDVHLSIDPEFSMKTGARPGTVIGTFDAKDINYTIQYLDTLVKENDLRPKILVIHRFTKPMVTNYRNILISPNVQIVMDMDGWGAPDKKEGTYNHVIYTEPVQFTGFKLFYKNDLKPPSTHVMTPEEVLSLTPEPSYIQYQ